MGSAFQLSTKMLRSFVFLSLLIVIHGLTQTIKNVKVTVGEKELKCTFKVDYTVDPFVVNKKKSKLTCKPKVSGTATAKLEIKDVGEVEFDFKITKGNGKVTSAKLVPAPTEAPVVPVPTGNVPMNCSCRLPLDFEGLMPETGPEVIAGRGLRLIQSRLNSVSLRNDQESNKKIATFNPSNRGGLIGLILLPILLPLIIAQIQALLAGRSLNIETEERREKLEKMLAELEAAQERVEEIVGDRNLVEDFIKTCNNNANGATFITNLTAFITAIQGLLTALGIGRSLPVPNAHNRQFGSGNLLGLLGNGGLGGNLGGLGGSAPSPAPTPAAAPSSPLLGLLGGSGGNGGDLSGLLGALGGSNGGSGDLGPLLGALAGSNGGSGDLSSLLEALGSANGGSGDLAPLLALVGGSDSSLIEGIISNVIQQQIDSVLSELDADAMVDELLLEFGINGGIEEALAELETLESEFDAMVEEFLAELEAEFTGFEGPLDIPLQCDCVPYEVMTG